MKMYHHVRGHMDNIYIAYNKNRGDKKDFEEVEIPDESAVYMPFIGKFDDTEWGKLTENEKGFWALKGFDSATWKGKKIYIGDIVNQIIYNEHGEAVSERRFVAVQLEHLFCLENEGLCITDIPISNKLVKHYVIGNIMQNPNKINLKVPFSTLSIQIKDK